MRVLLSLDAFKGSCSAADAGHALAAGLRAAVPDLEVVERPVADGGEGTVAALAGAGATLRTATVAGPTGQPVGAVYAVLPGPPTTAVVELAQAAGLGALPGGEKAPLTATTEGVGQLVRAALDDGVARVVLAVGGSATTDGGAGMLRALGARLLDADGRELPPGGAALARLARVDLDGLDPRLAPGGSSAHPVEVLVACDVDNPLLGPDGAAAVFAPQKGADAKDVALLECALTVWAATLRRATGRDVAGVPGAGAAGGTAYAALAALGATVTSGAQLVLDLTGFEQALQRADLVITGEGRLDAQTLRGKAPAGVAAAAARSHTPVIAVAGQVDLTRDEAERAGLRATYSLTDLAPDLETAMRRVTELLTATGERIATDLLTDRPTPTKDVTR